MDNTPEFARLFNTLDRAAFIELALIAIGAFALIVASQPDPAMHRELSRSSRT